MRRPLLIVAVAALFATGCGNLFDPAAAVVNGEKITISKLEAELEQYRETSQYQRLVAQAPEVEIERNYQQGYLTTLIREAVLEAEAEKRDIEVNPDEINDRVEEIKQELGSEGQFQEALKEDGLDLEELEFRVRIALLEEKLRAEVTKGVGPSEEELRAYYEDNFEEFQEVRAQHILLGADKLSLAEDLALRLQKADPKEVEKLFESLAAKYSEDPSTADNAGDLGWGQPGVAQYAPPLKDAVLELEVGVVSDPVQTQFGWHVIRVVGRRVTPFEEARASIHEAIGAEAIEEAWQEWLARAYDEADIKVNEKYGVLNPDSFSVENASADDVPAGEAPEAPATPSPAPSL